MIQWTKLQLDTTQFLLNQDAKDTDEAAIFFGETYWNAMEIAMDKNNNLVKLKSVDILIDAWKKVFKVQLDSPINLKSIPYNFIGLAMIKFWTGAIVSPLIPASADNMLLGTLNGIVFPGNAISVGSGIYQAFNRKEAPLVAGDLIKVYKDHAKTLQGIHVGMTISPGPPSSTSIPVLVPWKGLK